MSNKTPLTADLLFYSTFPNTGSHTAESNLQKDCLQTTGGHLWAWQAIAGKLARAGKVEVRVEKAGWLDAK